jgi:hypothetical protein
VSSKSCGFCDRFRKLFQPALDLPAEGGNLLCPTGPLTRTLSGICRPARRCNSHRENPHPIQRRRSDRHGKMRPRCQRRQRCSRVKALSIYQFVAGPTCTRLMAELGRRSSSRSWRPMAIASATHDSSRATTIPARNLFCCRMSLEPTAKSRFFQLRLSGSRVMPRYNPGRNVTPRPERPRFVVARRFCRVVEDYHRDAKL